MSNQETAWEAVKRSLGREFNWPGAAVGSIVALVLSILLDTFSSVTDGRTGFWIGAGLALVCVNVGRRVVKFRAKS